MKTIEKEIEDKIKHNAKHLMGLDEEIYDIEFLSRELYVLAVVLIEKKLSDWSVRIVNYVRKSKEVESILSKYQKLGFISKKKALIHFKLIREIFLENENLSSDVCFLQKKVDNLYRVNDCLIQDLMKIKYKRLEELKELDKV